MSEHQLNAAPARAVREPSLVDGLLPIVSLVGLLGLSYYLFGENASFGPNQIALSFCGLMAALIGAKNGMEWSAIRQAATDGIGTGIQAIFILLAVGALIGTWAMCGTIASMVYYGLKLLSPHYFYASTCAICAVAALSIGSSWTVAGTIGIGMMGIAQSMDLSPLITAGAVISGAYFGDKASPLSDTANLATAAAGSELFSHIRESLWTSVPALLLAIIGFALLGSQGDFDASATLRGMEQHVTVSLWTFLPLLLVLVLALKRVPPFVTIFASALAGGLLAVILVPQDVAALANNSELHPAFQQLKGVWAALATGYQVSTGDASVDKLLTRGGMSSMMLTIWLIMTALAFGAIVEHTGLLRRVITPLIDRAKSTLALVASLVGSCLASNALTADQYISIVLPARMFRQSFESRGLAPVMLSRVVGDSATVTSPLIPWNSCGAYMSAALGVSAISFAPYCFFNLLNPLLTVLFTVVGFRVLSIATPPVVGTQSGARS
ncbi:MAG TPA: Na+/H+ antiporter NhaC family protein [Dongiaceae bacterium]|nr:Na+/H+ antiporter NhaC family protein [Dongiaceae bacterium]